MASSHNEVVAAILREARRRHAPYTHVLAAIETGIVESGLRNLSYGDADSQGWRQERRSLYKDPMNLRDSVRRFFDEADAHDHGQSAGELAADVQRPAEQYRGRYAEVRGQAATILRRGGGAGDGGVGHEGSSTAFARVPTTRFNQKAFDQQEKLAILGQYLSTQPGASTNPLLTAGILPTQLPNPQDFTQTLTRRIALTHPINGGPAGVTRGAGGSREPSGDLSELFFRRMAIKNGQAASPITGHDTHVHVGTRTKQEAIAMGKLAQRMGLIPRENPYFDKVDPVHVQGSLHYQGRAVDVSGGTPRRLRRYARRVEHLFGVH